VNSNGGVGANLTYEQRNFDITDLPTRLGDTISDRAFIGAGQTFRVSLEPGTENTNASVRFVEPYMFDLPYSFSIEGYYRDRIATSTRKRARVGASGSASGGNTSIRRTWGCAAKTCASTISRIRRSAHRKSSKTEAITPSRASA
jgi:outer membrane protein assembly factor BamA